MERSRAKGFSGEHVTLTSARGVLILHGSRIRPCRGLEVSALDIAPTILALLGVPADTGLRGHIITAALPADFEPLAKRTTPYARLTANGSDDATQADDVIIERLKALGYVQ
jgi:hypothetical protein